MRCNGLYPVFIFLALTISSCALVSHTSAADLPNVEVSDDWAYSPMQKASIPVVDDAEWPASEIDSFILQALEGKRLRPVADTDRQTWLRRTSFDLSGLPPTVAQINEFMMDSSPDARSRVVDRLLASASFGERWARHWLDLVGYADQMGTSNNVFARYAWRYRDYLVSAYNDDLPFDQFIRQQIAGDLLPSDSIEQQRANLTATGFLVLGDVEVVESDKAKLRIDLVDQQVNKVSKAFLGMTLSCARCHDHKFDPISQRDYFAVAGVFFSTESLYRTEQGVWSSIINLQLPETADQQSRRAAYTETYVENLVQKKTERDHVAAEKKSLEESTDEQTDVAQDGVTSSADRQAKIDELTKRIQQLDDEIVHAEFFTPKVPQTYGVRDVQQPADMQITIRGNPRALGEVVPRGYIQVVHRGGSSEATIPTGESGRRQLADWIANADNSLTARVAVNRLWYKIFGEGIVRSVDYFGVRGETPSHPQLLDHLALDFIESGWSQKRLIRKLVLSRVYRLGNERLESAMAVDPENRLLWRMVPRRIDAEALRDSLLSVSGTLCRCGGGSAMPLEFPENVANLDPKSVNPPSFRLNKYRADQEYVRTVFLPVIRHEAQPGPAELRDVFDFAQPATCVGMRSVTAVPTQALFLMNSKMVRRRATDLASRVCGHASDDESALKYLWLCALNREITMDELQDALVFLKSIRERVTKDSSDQSTNSAIPPGEWVELCHAVVASNEFLMRL